MKFRTLIWAAIILGCVGLGLWQKDKLDLIWREYSSLYENIKYEDYSIKVHGPFISREVAKEDPEAAAVTEICLGCLHCKEDERILAIAEKLLEYPDNKFFLFELTKSLYWDKIAVDPQIALRLAERLIALEPNNANYHYLKCHLLLMDRRGSDINAALGEMEYANKCQDYSFPYDSYRERAINIANKAKLCQYLVRELWYSGRGNQFASDIWQQLMSQAKVAFTDGDTAKGMRITNALAQMQKRQLRDGDPYAGAIRRLRFFSGPYSFGHWDEPHGLELQRVNLTKERAKENRLQLCALMASPKNVTKEKEDQGKKEEDKRAVFLAVHPAAHAGQMFVAFLWGCGILLVINVVCGFGERAKIGFLRVLLFIAGCVCYFCIAKGFFLASFLDGFRYSSHYYPFSYIDALRPIPGLKYIEFEPVLVGSFVAGPIVAALALWGLSFVRPKKGAFWRFWYVRVLAALGIGGIAAFIALCTLSFRWEGLWQRSIIVGVLASILAWVIMTFAWWLFRCRITRLFLVATFLGLVTILASGYRYVHYLPIIIFVLTSAVVAVVKPGEGSSFKTVLRLFSRKPDVAAIRNKCLRLTAPFIVVYWVVFIALAPLVAKSINLEIAEFKTFDRMVVVLPEPNEAYQELMSTFEAESLSKMHIYRLLGLVMPEDLPAVLQRLKNTEFADYYRWGRLSAGPVKEASEQEKARLEKRRERQRWLNDGDLIFAMRGCGRDVVGVITDFLDNPDAERALVARARLGDSTAREKLEELLQTRMQSELDKKENEQAMHHRSYLDRPAKAADIIGALACISKHNEATGRFLDYIQNRKVSDLLEDYEFFEGLILLPTTHVCKVLNAYLDKARSWQPHVEKTPYGLIRNSPDRVLYPLRRLTGLYGNRQIAEIIFNTMLLAVNEGEQFDSFKISPYFGDESAELLKEGLSSENEVMRAWCVWQLRKIGYEWSREELAKLLTDESWKVRANAVLAGDKEISSLALRDQNGLVRLVASFLQGL